MIRVMNGGAAGGKARHMRFEDCRNSPSLSTIALLGLRMVDFFASSSSRTTPCLFLALLFFHSTHGWTEYVAKNPNGNVFGGGLGHISSSGGGTRNAYGSAFSSAGLRWTTALCLAGARQCLRLLAAVSAAAHASPLRAAACHPCTAHGVFLRQRRRRADERV